MTFRLPPYQPNPQNPTPVTIYTRFSSDLQNNASTEDQIRNCREAAERKGWAIADQYIRSDEATSGQSLAGRGGLDDLLKLATQVPRPFEGIVIDDTSRFGRNLSDTLPLSDVFAYHGVFLYFVNRDLDSRDPNFRTLFITSGQQDESFSRGLAEKVHRGMRGRVLRGFIASGQTYGYTNRPIENPARKGRYGRPYVEAVEMVKNPTEAAVVVRIFEMAAGGLGSQVIAGKLNAEGVPSPLQATGKGKRSWCMRTIRKMLANDKYRGIYLWNRTKIVRNPITGRKEQHARPQSEWERIEKPEWRIISDELWAAKETSLKLRTEKVNRASSGGLNRSAASREYIFSGRLTCAVCGGKIAVIGGSGSRVRYGCRTHRQRGSAICPNTATILLRQLQAQLISALADNLRDPRLRKHLSGEFHRQLQIALEEGRRRANELQGHESALKAKLSALNEEAKNIVDAIAKCGPLPILQTRLDSTLAQTQTVEDLLAKKDQTPETVQSFEEVEAFLDRKMEGLAEVLTGDLCRAKQEVQKRVKELRLLPVRTADGLSFEVTGDVRLFAPEDYVKPGTCRSISTQHYTHVLPFSTIVYQNLEWSRSRALKRAA